jgi:hypothetical protein
MSIKIINISVPFDAIIPEILTTFSPEENYMMLKIGSETLSEGRKVVANLTTDEIFKKVRNDFNTEIEKLNNEIISEKKVSFLMNEKITKMYETQIDQLNKKFENALSQIEIYKQCNSSSLNEELNKVKEKYDLLYREKEKQVERMTEVHEKLIVHHQSSKSTSHKGSEGEKTFSEYAETFIDFKGFNIIDKHTQGGEGDFHLHFEEFDVLADAKNYKKKVPVDQREKIKKDLIKNEHIHFGWLVSLNTSIDKFDKSPIMYEWINTTQCLVYINNLSSFEDPKKILRIVWFTCKELYKMIEDVDQDETDITELKEKNFKLIDKIKNARKTIREINTSMNTTRNLIQVMDDELKGMIENETNEIVGSNISLFDDWWEENIEITSEKVLVSSTDLWTQFKHDNKLLINEMNISGENFKQYLKSKVPMSGIILRNKNANSAFDVKGIQLKSAENKVTEKLTVIKEKIDIELNDEILKKPKIIKKSPEIVFSKELDIKLLNEYYSNKDIMEISGKNNIKPWQVVSLLMKYKIIKKRDEALGYDKYKETEEYKQKMEKN